MSSITRNLILSGVVLAAVGGAAWWYSQDVEEPAAPSYTQAKIKRGDITAVVSATGTVNPVNTVQVGSQVSGTIAKLAADFNDRVEQGQVIAQIDPAVYRARLAEAQANLQAAEANAAKAEVTVRDAKRGLGRQENLFRKKLVAESVRDTARFAYESALVEHRAKLAAVAQATAARDREQVNLAYTTIYAPIDGVVISRDVDVGQTVAASLQAPTLFTIAEDLTHMQVEADVDESFIGQVHDGEPVSFTVFAYPDRTFKGRVTQVRLQPKVDAGVVKYNAIIDVNNPDLALKPGMTATVSIQVAEHKDVLQVPASALRFVPDWPEDRLAKVRSRLKPGERLVWQQHGDTLKPVPVTTGIVGERFVEVSGEGLAAGESVLVPEKRKSQRKRRFGVSLF